MRVAAAAVVASLALGLAPVRAQSPDGPEAAFLAAMRYSEAEGSRTGDAGAAVRAYIAAGLVARKPDKRRDYTDYRALKKPARLLGQNLLVIEEEYIVKFIGCGVNLGVGAIVEIDADDARMTAFAKEHRCALSEEDARDDLAALGMAKPAGRVVSISCRERDAFDR